MHRTTAILKMIKLVVLLSLSAVALGLPTNSSYEDVNVGPRISGGDETDIAHNPWQLALLYHGRHFCGAVEIQSRWALTAAHCLHGALVEHLSVRAGSTTKSFGGQIVDVARIYEHPDYNVRTADYDFALLHLMEPITVLPASPATLPEPNTDLAPGEEATISGWGTQTEDGLTAEILRVVNVPIIGRVACQEAHRHNTITERMFCASDARNERGACRSDGGGPVIVNGRLAGIVSWGISCENDRPEVHARVSSVLDWIYSTTGL